jgi:hypothetical protein
MSRKKPKRLRDLTLDEVRVELFQAINAINTFAADRPTLEVVPKAEDTSARFFGAVKRAEVVMTELAQRFGAPANYWNPEPNDET